MPDWAVWVESPSVQRKTPVKCRGYAWGDMGEFVIDWYIKHPFK